eukprot:50868_1
MHVYDKLDEAEDILKQMERCGSFSLRHSCSDRGSEEQQGRGRVEDDQEGFDLLIKLKRIQLLLRENESLETEIGDQLQSSDVEKDKATNDCINATPALLDEVYENISEIVRLYRSMTSGKEQLL